MAVMDTIRKTFGISSSIETDKFLVGVELEIEDFGGWKAGHSGGPSHVWNITEDGSLRNNGKEFISPPVTPAKAILMFEELHKILKHPKGEPFSERTSIHVHINCLDLTQQQVKSIILWYSLFEKAFFAQCAPSRASNIHCVGLDQTIVSEAYSRSLPIMVNKWSKYTALNILPLKSQGTIEFRHMEGHNDAKRFAQWLLCIERLWNLGQTHILNKSMLNDEGLVEEGFDTLFVGTPVMDMKNSILALSQDSILDVKLAFC